MSWLWAKTASGGDPNWHPLILHLLDVAASAEAILEREPPSTRARIGEIIGLPWPEAQPWILLVVACHDLGKACPGFQYKWPEQLLSTGLRLPRSPNTHIRHGFVSQIVLGRRLEELGWPTALSELVSDAVGCHHGERASMHAREEARSELRVGSGNRLECVRIDWEEVRSELLHALGEVFQPTVVPTRGALSGPDFMLLAGLTSFADWIGSNEEWFTFGSPKDCLDPRAWFERRRRLASCALQAIGWGPRTPLLSRSETFEQTFGFPPRALQVAAAKAVDELEGPAVVLVEAPTGEGKTEAAFYAHLELQRRFGHRGMYIALPTKATGNAMFKRTLEFLQKRGSKRSLDLQLLHGGKMLNDDFERMRLAPIYDEDGEGEVRAREWFTRKKRALLSEYGVGTIDQALVTILPVRHNFVRLWGLANRVVILDEIHAYDAYTGTLLLHLLRWLQALGSSVVLLSATLSPSIRRRLASALRAQLPEDEETYPRLSVFLPGEAVQQTHFEAEPSRRLTVRLKRIGPDLQGIRTSIEQHLMGGGTGLALVNTVQRAQELYRLFPEGEPLIRDGVSVGKTLADETQILLFHARFPADQRQVREDEVMATFGPDGNRGRRKFLIATQVAEQSLDLDFDLIVTDLAPIDLLFQRAGRLWRHERKNRALSEPVLIVAGLGGDAPPPFGGPLWWEMVYREDLLLRTWILLRHNSRTALVLPDDVDPLVRMVYEDEIVTPEFLVDRMDHAVQEEGIAIAQRQQADWAIIGFPNDSSWNDPARFVLYDEDAPGVHRTLMARTRLGEDAIIAIPISSGDELASDGRPTPGWDKALFVRGVSLSRSEVVNKLRTQVVPDGWGNSPLLRGCAPLRLDPSGYWTVDPKVRLDDDLGVVYGTKEAK